MSGSFGAGRVLLEAGILLQKFTVAFALALRSARVFLIVVGVPLNRPFLVLTCNGGTDAAGMFSEFAAVLGLLEHHDTWKRLYAGMRVDFKDQGLYFDPARGPNWWEYYFEPVVFGSEDGTATTQISAEQHDLFALRVERTLPRRKSAALVARYIHVKPKIEKTVEAFTQANFADHFVIGVHYRGTDHTEAPRMPYEAVSDAVDGAIASVERDRFRIFVATDEQAFLEHMLNRFPQKICFYDSLRSIDGRRVHDRDEHSYRKGEEAIIDCLTLSRCHRLVRTQSNLGMAATLFNPSVPQDVLNTSY